LGADPVVATVVLSARPGTFPCAEAECDGAVRVEPAYVVTYRIGISSFASVYRCDACGRLHYDDGSPVYADAFQLRAFWLPKSGFFDKRLSSRDQAEYLHRLMRESDSASSEEGSKHILLSRLRQCVRLGHAQDCAFNAEGKKCDCGVHEGEAKLTGRASS